MSIVTPRTMAGVMELLPREQVAFQRMLDGIRAGFERFGFQPVETPVMERVDVLLTKTGGETERQVYFAQSSGSREQGKPPELALRFDLTVPLARYVAEHEHELTFPFRRYQIQRVYRGERAQKGRYREFYQCDIDVIGKDSLSLRYDAEVPAVIAQVFRALDVGAFTIHVNNRKILMGLLADLGLSRTDQTLVLREVDKLDKRGAEAVAATLAEERFGLGDAGAARILELVGIVGSPDDVLTRLDALPCEDEGFRAGVAEMREVAASIAAFGVPASDWCIDLSIARGLDYYTGTVYETLLDDHRQLGSVCSGGRYENLAGLYTRSRLPGVGISIGATRLFSKLLELGLLEVAGLVDVLVTRQSPELDAAYLELGTRLRQSGLNTEVVFEDGKLPKQLKAANRAGVRFVVIMGPQEHDRGTAMLKDMQAGEQVELKLEDLADGVRARQSAGAAGAGTGTGAGG